MFLLFDLSLENQAISLSSYNYAFAAMSVRIYAERELLRASNSSTY